MGSNQLLLIVLGVIIIGIAVLVALGIFSHSVAENNLDRVTEFLMELGVRAQKYYRTPEWLSGGGHTFNGLTADLQGIALLTNLSSNEYGTFSISVAGNDTEVTLLGVGIEDGDQDGTNCTATLSVQPHDMTMTIVNR
jgi:Tfp pilus assembly protein PilE